MEELRKEFEKKTGRNAAEPHYEWSDDFVISLKDEIKLLRQNLSKQVTEEDFTKFIWNLDWSSDMEMEYKDYLISRIFSHYILIPKEK
jgi:hypothetical protein